MLYDGSRVAIRNLLKSPEYNNARADVLHYEASKGRYALKLIHPAFGGKCLLLKADNIEFLHVSLPQHLSDAQRELGAKSIKFVETEEFGKALAATADFAVGDVLFYDSPFMVVSNPEGHEKWMVRWDCVYEQNKINGGAVLKAFQGLYDGGPDMRQFFMPDARRTIEVLWGSVPGGAARLQNDPEAVCGEATRCASDFGRWQTNQHDLPGRRSALYLLAPMVAHSCFPNTEWDDPQDDGRVGLRCVRPIKQGEVLGVNYMQKEFLALKVGQRQAVLQHKRFFKCMCVRCESEAQG